MHLISINLIQPSKWIFMETKTCGSFKMFYPIIFKVVFFLIIVDFSNCIRRFLSICFIERMIWVAYVLIVHISSSTQLLNNRSFRFYICMTCPIMSETFVDLIHYLFLHIIWYRKLALYVKKSFKFWQLSLETHVWENDWSSLTNKAKRIFKIHLFLLHQVSNGTGCRSRYPSITVNQYTTSSQNTIFNKSYSSRKMAQ